MIQTDPFRDRTKEYEEWFVNYPHVYRSEVEAVRKVLGTLPENISGIEVGVGTGRFAKPLGIKQGVEPVMEMAAIAQKRGIEILKGIAENLPFRDLHFDFVLFVTICHLHNVPAALKEAHRVLKNKGSIIIGFLDKNQNAAQSYVARKNRSHFYKHATFYTVDRAKNMLKKANFSNLEFSQTLFGEMEAIDEIQSPREGFGEGSFVIVKANKKV